MDGRASAITPRGAIAVKEIATPNPHPGAEYYIDAITKAITPNTRLIGFTHLTSTVGDVFPAKEICQLARERGILTLVDGAQTFGFFDVNLGDIQPDFYSGSAHKWPCGPKENGVLFINKSAHSKIWATIYSAYPGGVGISKTFESFGQRDEPAMIAFGEALKLQTKIGRAVIEKRSRELTTALIDDENLGVARIVSHVALRAVRRFAGYPESLLSQKPAKR